MSQGSPRSGECPALTRRRRTCGRHHDRASTIRARCDLHFLPKFALASRTRRRVRLLSVDVSLSISSPVPLRRKRNSTFRYPTRLALIAHLFHDLSAPEFPSRSPRARCNPVQGATATLASTATLALWNL